MFAAQVGVWWGRLARFDYVYTAAAVVMPTALKHDSFMDMLEV